MGVATFSNQNSLPSYIALNGTNGRQDQGRETAPRSQATNTRGGVSALTNARTPASPQAYPSLPAAESAHSLTRLPQPPRRRLLQRNRATGAPPRVKTLSLIRHTTSFRYILGLWLIESILFVIYIFFNVKNYLFTFYFFNKPFIL